MLFIERVMWVLAWDIWKSSGILSSASQCMLSPSCKVAGLAESQVSAQAVFKATHTDSPQQAVQPPVLPAA